MTRCMDAIAVPASPGSEAPAASFRAEVVAPGKALTSPGLVFSNRRVENSNRRLVTTKSPTCETHWFWRPKLGRNGVAVKD